MFVSATLLKVFAATAFTLNFSALLIVLEVAFESIRIKESFALTESSRELGTF